MYGFLSSGPVSLDDPRYLTTAAGIVAAALRSGLKQLHQLQRWSQTVTAAAGSNHKQLQDLQEVATNSYSSCWKGPQTD